MFPLAKTEFPLVQTIFPLAKTVFPFAKTVFPEGKTVFPLMETVFPFRENVFPLGETVFHIAETVLLLVDRARANWTMFARGPNEVSFSEHVCSGTDIHHMKKKCIFKILRAFNLGTLSIWAPRPEIF